MPIYSYRCKACGFVKDALQKISEQPLTDCPSCGQSTFEKQLTAAGFQLKGSGWYATDFKNGSGKKPDVSPTSTSTESSAKEAASDPSTGTSPEKQATTPSSPVNQASTASASSDPKSTL